MSDSKSNYPPVSHQLKGLALKSAVLFVVVVAGLVDQDVPWFIVFIRHCRPLRSACGKRDKRNGTSKGVARSSLSRTKAAR